MPLCIFFPYQENPDGRASIPQLLRRMCELITGASAGIVAAFITWIGLDKFGAGYFQKKGSNLADKQDIEHLTQLVEQVKAQQTAKVEEIKSTLSRRNDIHKVVFEMEFTCYKEATLKANQAWDAFIILTTKPKDATALNELEDLMLDYLKYLKSNKPFFEQLIYSSFLEVKDALFGARKAIKNPDVTFDVDQEKMQLSKIKGAVQKSTDAIRERMKKLLD